MTRPNGQVREVHMGPKWSFEHKKPFYSKASQSPDKNERMRVNTKKMRTMFFNILQLFGHIATTVTMQKRVIASQS